MPTVKIEPVKQKMPYDAQDAPVPNILEELAVAGNTAELQAALGARLSEEDAEEVIRNDSFTKLLAHRKPQTIKSPAIAATAAQFLREYASNAAIDAVAVRSATTYKLMELANHEDPKVALKALELLGKHSDIGLFTNRSEVTINYKNPEDLENAIKDKVKRLLNADVIDITPVGVDLDEELGFAPNAEDVEEEGSDDESASE
jgi:hypothetical protein